MFKNENESVENHQKNHGRTRFSQTTYDFTENFTAMKSGIIGLGYQLTHGAPV